jgi:twitching motility protein PilT
MARLDAFLQLGCAQGCSDIHLAMGVPPMLRLHGDLLPVKYRDLGAEELTSLLREIVTDGQWATFTAGWPRSRRGMTWIFPIRKQVLVVFA